MEKQVGYAPPSPIPQASASYGTAVLGRGGGEGWGGVRVFAELILSGAFSDEAHRQAAVTSITSLGSYTKPCSDQLATKANESLNDNTSLFLGLAGLAHENN